MFASLLYTFERLFKLRKHQANSLDGGVETWEVPTYNSSQSAQEVTKKDDPNFRALLFLADDEKKTQNYSFTTREFEDSYASLALYYMQHNDWNDGDFGTPLTKRELGKLDKVGVALRERFS